MEDFEVFSTRTNMCYFTLKVLYLSTAWQFWKATCAYVCLLEVLLHLSARQGFKIYICMLDSWILIGLQFMDESKILTQAIG